MISFYWFISSNSFRFQSQYCNRLKFHLWTVLLSCDNFKKFSIILSHHTSLSKELIRSELLTRSRNQRPSDYQRSSDYQRPSDYQRSSDYQRPSDYQTYRFCWGFDLLWNIYLTPHSDWWVKTPRLDRVNGSKTSSFEKFDWLMQTFTPGPDKCSRWWPVRLKAEISV